MMPPRDISISARTLLDETKAISMPEKNAEHSSAMSAIISGEVYSGFKAI